MVMINEMFAGDFLKSADIIHKQPLLATIKNVREDMVFDGHKLILSFHEFTPEMIVNKTNAMTIAERYGNNTDNWVGKQLKLIVQKVNMAGSVVDGLRVQVPPVEAAVEPPKVLTDAFGDTGSVDEDVPLW